MRSKSIEVMNQIKTFIEEYYSEHYNSPSTTQIAEAIGRTRGNVHNYLVEMRERGMLSYSGREISTDKIREMNPKLVRAAILGNVSCGLPQFAEENIEEYVSLPESLFGKGTFYLLRARGESMVEAGIDSGDLVVIRQQSDAKEGQIVVALVDNEATLKRFYKEKNRIRLHPENREMDDIYVDDCIIQGVAVKVLKDLI